MSDYFDGAIMAYRDAAEFVKHLSDNLPSELKFIKSAFDDISYGLIEKSNNVLAIKNGYPIDE